MRTAGTISTTSTAILEEIRPAARKPLDLMVAVGSALIVALVLLLVWIVTDTDAATTDPGDLRALVPPSLLALLVGVANLTVIILVSITALEVLIRREFREVVRGLVAGALGYGLAGTVNMVVLAVSISGSPPDVLVSSDTGGLFTTPLHGYLAAVIGYVRAMPLGHLPRVRVVMWVGIAVTAASVLLAGVTTSLSLLLTVLVGGACASVARYAVGLSVPVLATDRLVRELRRFDLEPLTLAARDNDAHGNQRFIADTVDQRLDILLMRADATAGLWKRLLGVLLLRTPVAPALRFDLHRRVEHTALMYFAVRAAGDTTVPEVVGITDLGAGTIALVRKHVRVRSLSELGDQEITSALLERVWSSLALLHSHRIVHGNLSGANVGVRLDGRVTFTDLSAGSVAALPLRASLDVAALVTALTVRVGEQRAVRSAVRSLGVEVVASALPFLQPAGMPRALRTELRERPALLGAIRARITAIAPEAPARPAKLERMRPRTVVSVAAATVVGVVLVNQLVGVDLSTIRQADPGWTAAALATSVLCMLAAAMALMGFVPFRLPFWPTVLVQFAVSFVRIAAPPAVGMVALNTRYVAKVGASGGVALSAVGLSQAVGLLMHVPMLLIAAYLTGSTYLADFSPSLTLIVVSAVLSVGGAVVLLLPAVRRAVVDRIRPYFRGVVPRFLDLLANPLRLVMGFSGTFLLTAGFILCLQFSVLAFGGAPSLAAVAVVFLAGNALGAAAPTPGGLGAVEAALLGGLTTVAGLPAATALPAVLLFRLLTFWLPALPGWGAFHYLQRREAI